MGRTGTAHRQLSAAAAAHILRTAMTRRAPRYTTTAIGLHWLLALMIGVSLCVGLSMTGLAMTPTRLKLFNWHKWAGICILALTALRLAWRLRHPPPPDVPMPAWQARAAHTTHLLLYLLCIALPLSGWAYSSAVGFPVVVFGVLPLPDFVPVDRELAALCRQAHHLLAFALAVLVAGHVAAALKHRFVDHDDLLQRMTPTRR
jgi:cytochrome b561